MFDKQRGKGFVRLESNERYEFRAATLSKDETFLYIHHVATWRNEAVVLAEVKHIDFTTLD